MEENWFLLIQPKMIKKTTILWKWKKPIEAIEKTSGHA